MEGSEFERAAIMASAVARSELRVRLSQAVMELGDARKAMVIRKSDAALCCRRVWGYFLELSRWATQVRDLAGLTDAHRASPGPSSMRCGKSVV